MKRIAVCLILMLSASVFTAIIQNVSSRQDDKPQDKHGRLKAPGKFIPTDKNGVPGEYIVTIKNDVNLKDADIEALADELIGKYGGSIKTTNDITMETKQEDGSIKTEILKRGGKKAISKTGRRFYVAMTEGQAKALSEDPRVDDVTQAAQVKVISDPPSPISREESTGIYKEGVDLSKLPREKFRRGNPNAIPGEFIVTLKAELTGAEVENITEEFVKTYGITVQSVWKFALKGFSAKMSESVARAISEDTRVDHVSENLRF